MEVPRPGLRSGGMEAGPFAGRRLHFVGIGGAGMSGLALVARELGAEVTGSDRAESPYSARLRAGGHRAARRPRRSRRPQGAELVVSTAIADDNPELVRGARRRRAGAPPRRPPRRGQRAQAHDRGGRHPRQDHHRRRWPPSCCWSRPRPGVPDRRRAARRWAPTPRWGARRLGVVEADESDRSFLKLVARGGGGDRVELDHHATYRSLGELERAFESFAGPGASCRARPGRAAAPRRATRSATGSTRATSAPRPWSCCRSARASRWRAWRSSWRCPAATTC